jgi:hypothetical protein
MPKSSKPAPSVRPKIGDVVHVEFYDHAQGGEDAMHFEIWGKLIGITKLAYKVATWQYVNDVDRATDDNKKDNEDWFIIVKKAVVSIRTLT